MSAKERFLQKLQPLPPVPFSARVKADILEFGQRLEQLQKMMDSWLVGTGIKTTRQPVSLVDLLAGRAAFSLPRITVIYDQRKMLFTPVFLYGHGVTGGIEVALSAEGSMTTTGRLYMKAGAQKAWSFTLNNSTTPERLTEEAFFSLIESLIPG